MVSTSNGGLNEITAGTTRVLENGRGIACAPCISYKSCIVVIGTDGMGLANGGLASGGCCGRSKCPKKLESEATGIVVSGCPSSVVSETMGNVLPRGELNEGVNGGLFICTSTSRGRDTRGPVSVSVWWSSGVTGGRA